jgi:hypothetical protein
MAIPSPSVLALSHDRLRGKGRRYYAGDSDCTNQDREDVAIENAIVVPPKDTQLLT